MSLKLGYLVMFSLWFTCTNALSCTIGYEINSPFGSPLILQNTTACNTNQERCIRGEGIANIFGASQTYSFVSCARRSTCDRSCEDVRDVALSAIFDGLGIRFRTCESICCDTDNCNADSVAAIRARARPTISPLPSVSPSTVVPNIPITSPISEPRLTCYEGYSLFSPLFPLAPTWSEVECSSDQPQTCVRGEGVYSGLGENFTFFIGSCYVSSVCDRDCNELFNEVTNPILGRIPEESSADNAVLACEIICCNTSECNNNTVASIRASATALLPTTPMASTTTPISTSEIASTRATTMRTTTLETTELPEIETPVQETTPTTQESGDISCYEGYVFDLKLPTDRQPFSTTKKCPDEFNYACIRQDLVLSDGPGNVILLTCASKDDCDEPCVDVARNVIDDFVGLEGDGSDILRLEDMEFAITFCNRTCCQKNLCNGVGSLKQEVTQAPETEETTAMGAGGISVNKMSMIALVTLSFLGIYYET